MHNQTLARLGNQGDRRAQGRIHERRSGPDLQLAYT